MSIFIEVGDCFQLFKIGCILVAQLIIFSGEVEIDHFQDPDMGMKDFLVLESGDIEFVSAEDTSANSNESDDNEEGDKGGDSLRH